MLDSSEFTHIARDAGFDFFTGVPCSLLTSLINEVIADPQISYVGATSEGEACGIAAGAWLAGKSPVVILQNSGLGNTINPLTSLHHSFRIPALMLVTWRGEPGVPDEPQHDVMGHATHALLDAIGIAHAPLPSSAEALAQALNEARRSMDETGLPFVFIVRKGQIGGTCLALPPVKRSITPLSPAFEPQNLVSIAGDGNNAPASTRFEVLSEIVAAAPDDSAIIATTGKTGRELFTVSDSPQHLYVVGSMGCASAMGLGIALNSDRPVIIADGDGAALMKLGNLATIGHQQPGNLIHILLDNGVHDSTGGQATVSPGIDFAAIATACGYRTSVVTTRARDMGQLIDLALSQPGPHFIQAIIAPGSIQKLGRPDIGPDVVARRMRNFLSAARAPAISMPPEHIAAA